MLQRKDNLNSIAVEPVLMLLIPKRSIGQNAWLVLSIASYPHYLLVFPSLRYRPPLEGLTSGKFPRYFIIIIVTSWIRQIS
jgi:hypothetical protein